MGLYEELCAQDLVPIIHQMGSRMDWDGKVRLKYGMEQDSPWIETGADPERKCNLWLKIHFQYFSLIPRQCLGCWKIVFKPRTLKRLLEVHALQQAGDGTGLMAKCGVEVRGFTRGLGGYSAFWYNPLGCGLKKARENTEKVKEILQESNVVLKRGCTEMEVYSQKKFGKGSDEWELFLNEHNDQLQKKLEETFIVLNEEELRQPMPPEMKIHVTRKWIEWAMEHAATTGDYTYRDLMDQDQIPDLVNYSGSIHRDKDFPAMEVKDGTDNSGNIVEALD